MKVNDQNLDIPHFTFQKQNIFLLGFVYAIKCFILGFKKKMSKEIAALLLHGMEHVFFTKRKRCCSVV